MATDSKVEVGIIGALGDMGRLYAKLIATKYPVVNVCDLPEKYEALQRCFKDLPAVRTWPSGFDVVRRSDFM